MSSMRSAYGRPGRRLKNEINVVPYIDVMLVLLVIFMVTAPLITPGVIELPSVGQSASVPVSPIEIQIKQDGSVQWRKRESGTQFVEVPRNALAQTILSTLQPNQPVLIAADGRVPYESVVKVMDDLRANGVTRLGLLVDQKPTVPKPNRQPAGR